MARKTKRDAAASRSQSETQYKGTGVWPAVIAGLVLGLAVIIFVAQNTNRIALEFLWFDFRTSPAVLMLATAFLAVAGSVIVGAAVRRRRRRILADREELQHLRGVSEPAAPPPPETAPESSPSTPQ